MDVKRILLVDDEAHVRNVLSLKLKAAGFEVETASDGEVGFAVANEKIPDVVVTDFFMPHMTGLEMAQKLKINQRTANIPLLMITSRGDLLTPELIATTNIRKTLDKPFSPRQVTAIIC